MQFNLFDPYIFIIQKVTLYCSPIDRSKFQKEFRKRYQLDCAQKSSEIGCFRKSSLANNSDGCRESWILSHPKQVYKMVREYQMISNLNMVIQMLYILVMLHLFIKSIVHTVFAGNDKEKIKYLDSIYYPHVAGVSSRPYLFNYLSLGCTLLALLNRVIRVRDIIYISLRNAEKCMDLRVAQLNFSYLASFYLTFKEWLSLWQHLNNHESRCHLNRKAKANHLKLDESVQEKLPTLVVRDAIFYLNSIDFGKCYKFSVLPADEERIKRYDSWHYAFPLDRVSVLAFRDIIVATIFGTIAIFIGSLVAVAGLIYLELRSEFPDYHKPSLGEMLLMAPSHWSSATRWIRTIETLLIFSPQALYIYDLACALMDVLVIASRTRKMAQIFEIHLELIHRQAEFNALERLGQAQLSNHLQEIDNSNLDLSYLLEYNQQIRRDIALIDVIYHEFLNTRKHHTKFLNMFVLGTAACIAYTIPVLMSQTISFAESCIMQTFLMSCTLPIVVVLFYCAGMERTVSSRLIGLTLHKDLM